MTRIASTTPVVSAPIGLLESLPVRILNLVVRALAPRACLMMVIVARAETRDCDFVSTSVFTAPGDLQSR
jgi:hypothetical protein